MRSMAVGFLDLIREAAVAFIVGIMDLFEKVIKRVPGNGICGPKWCLSNLVGCRKIKRMKKSR